MRPMKLIGALAVAIGLSLVSPADAAEQSQLFKNLSPEDRAAIEQIVRDYILDHPDIVFEAADKVRAREQQAEDEKRRAAAKSVRQVDAQDHIRGNPKAQVRVVEYSDFECPFCKSFHPTLKQVMDEYGKDGRVAWIYRQFPLDSLHSKARKEAQATECANEIGGNDAFWTYADRLFEIAPSNDRLDLALLPKVAEEVGLDRAKFEDCLKGDSRGGKYADHIEADVQNATAAGGTGTPYTVVIAANGKTFPINGAQPYRVVKQIIDLALAEK
ncbi:MAG: thioredoxin domain-containing protein [Hyphomicrobiales bacterium]|nr:thioredoxin domain-containing protein [Hyphomicrobiales bacterium]